MSLQKSDPSAQVVEANKGSGFLGFGEKIANPIDGAIVFSIAIVPIVAEMAPYSSAPATAGMCCRHLGSSFSSRFGGGNGTGCNILWFYNVFKIGVKLEEEAAT
ncbi:unnamed protein product [Camellia sinensis]